LPNTKKRSAAPVPVALDDPLCDRIIGAAFGTFMTKGYAGTSMIEIATRAKISNARMRLPPDLPPPTNRDMLGRALVAFGATVIREVCEPAATSMYRLAVAEAERSPDVAAALNANRFVNRHALEQLLVRAQSAGVLGQGDPPRMMEQFFALLWGDLLLSRLLGAAGAPARGEIERRANEATAAFLRLYT
jgi:AcrR family transcriptional regulator